MTKVCRGLSYYPSHHIFASSHLLLYFGSISEFLREIL
jgi:hypothetical protein